MTTFKFTTYNAEDRESAKFNLLPQGNYYFEIKSAMIHTSKTSGKDSIKLFIAVKKDLFKDTYNLVFDYLTDNQNFSWKIANFFRSIGQESVYSTGEVDVDSLPGKSGHLKIGIRQAANGYGPSNAVLDYMTEEDVKSELPTSAKPIAHTDDEFDDSIPF